MFGFKGFTIARKLPLALLLSAVLVSAGVGIASYIIGASAMAAMPPMRSWSSDIDCMASIMDRSFDGTKA